LATRFFRQRPDFARLWVGQSISQLGSQVTLVALPLLAITTLNASTLEVGLLAGSETLPFLIVGLPAGVWVDRWRRRPVLITADAGRGLLLASVPLAHAFGILHMAQLYVVAMGTGVLTVFFDVAYQAYVPNLVERDVLLDANARLEVSHSAAQLVGPGIGGLLVQGFTAATAILIDTISYALSAFVLLGIRTEEPPPQRHIDEDGQARSLAASVREGLRYVLRHRLLAPLAACTALFNFFSAMAMAVFMLYAVRELGVSAATIGLLFSAGGLGFLVGTLLTTRIGRRFGVGTALSIGAVFQGTAFLLVPAAPRSAPVPFFLAAMLLEALTGPVYNVTQISLRQTVTPAHMQGRMTATMRFLVWGALPLGSVLGGVLGAALGRRETLWVAAIGSALSALPVLLSPLRRLKDMPEPVVSSGIGSAHDAVWGQDPPELPGPPPSATG
jgi:MFS family permease